MVLPKQQRIFGDHQVRGTQKVSVDLPCQREGNLGLQHSQQLLRNLLDVLGIRLFLGELQSQLSEQLLCGCRFVAGDALLCLAFDFGVFRQLRKRKRFDILLDDV